MLSNLSRALSHLRRQGLLVFKGIAQKGPERTSAEGGGEGWPGTAKARALCLQGHRTKRT